MTWGSFSNTHLLTLAFAVLVSILIYLILKRNKRSMQILTLFLLSLFSLTFLVLGVLSHKDDLIRNLPFSLSAISIILLPLAVLTRGKYLCNLLLIWSAGSIVSLVFNYDMANVELLTYEFFSYFTMHLFGAAIPILLFELNLVKREVSTIKLTVFFTIAFYTVAHLVNLAINTTNGWSVAEGVNYMATMDPSSSLHSFIYAIMPLQYWYMALALPVLLLYIVYWYLPEILDRHRRRKPLRKKLKDIDRYYEEYEKEFIDDIIDKKF